jgi:modulator of FtsH protease
MTVPGDWQDFAEVIGSASGALTGLLFVAVSINASRIAGHRGLRASATQTLVLFLTPLMMAAALLAPGQPDWVFGAEFNRRTPNVIVMLLFVASGTVLVCGSDAGLYLLLPAALIAFVSGVVNAWYFLLPPPQRPNEEATPPKAPLHPGTLHPGTPPEPKAASESP